MSELAHKVDSTKPRLDLLATSMLTGAASVMTHALKSGKYEANNWRKGLPWSTAYSALQRHLTDFNEGHDIDHDSGLPALWHAACDLMFLIEFQAKGTGVDDRYKGPQK